MYMKKTRKSLVTILFTAFMFGMLIIPNSTVTGQKLIEPMPVERPVGIFMGQIHGKLLGLIRGMQSANFTPDNVYYGVYNSEGGYNYPLVGSRERNISLNILIF